MIERHYEEEALVTMIESGAAESDQHLTACAECSEKLETFRILTDALHHAATWDKREINETPNPQTIATLRAFAENMASEDAAAAAFLEDLLSGSRETWMPHLHEHPEYRTPGTVRRLIAATDHALDTMPADAVEITALATEIADHLDPAAHRPDTLARLRGGAWRERAYALFYTGQFAEAEKAVSVSEDHFAACVVDEYELARVGIVRAVVERGLERDARGITSAIQSARTFSDFGDITRLASARLAEVQLRFRSGDYASARHSLLELEQRVRECGDAHMHAAVLANLGYCAHYLGKTEESMRYIDAAATLFVDLGVVSEAARVRWNVARLLAAEGRVDDALQRFRRTRAEFDSLGMIGAATLVTLEIAELLLIRGDFDAVSVLCREAVDSFAASGLAHTTRALTALGLMAESVRCRTATPALARHVREYVERLPAEPRLLFAPPPDAFLS